MSRATRIRRPVQLLRHQARPAGATTEKWEFTFRIYRLLWKVSYGPVSHEQNRGYTSLILNHICQEAGRGRGVRLARTNPSAPLDSRSVAGMTMGPRRGGSRTAPTSRWATDFGCAMAADEHSLGFFLAALPRRTDDTPSLPCRREPIPAPTPGFPLVGGNDGGPASAGMVAGSCHSERSEESKATAGAYTSSLDSRSAPAPYSDAGAEMTMGPRRGGSRTAPTSRWATDSGCAMEAAEQLPGILPRCAPQNDGRYSVAPVQTGAHPRPHAWIPARGRE